MIHQLERNEWLLLSAFQQGLQQKLVFVLIQEKAFSWIFNLHTTFTEAHCVMIEAMPSNKTWL